MEYLTLHTRIHNRVVTAFNDEREARAWAHARRRDADTLQDADHIEVLRVLKDIPGDGPRGSWDTITIWLVTE